MTVHAERRGRPTGSSPADHPTVRGANCIIPTTEGGTFTLRLHPQRILVALLLVITMLLVIGAIVPYPLHTVWLGRESWALSKIGTTFDLNGEGNLPAFFSAMQLLACALVLGILAALSRRQGSRWRFHWAVLAGGFLFMAIDEASQLHELLAVPGSLLADLLGWGPTTHAVWIPVALVIVVPVGLAYIPFLFALPRRILVLFCASGTTFVAGAMGLEAVQATIWDGDFGDVTYFALVLVEEALEMVAIAVFLFATLLVLSKTVQGRVIPIRISFDSPPAQASASGGGRL
jgi:hypothetical protein